MYSDHLFTQVSLLLIALLVIGFMVVVVWRILTRPRGSDAVVAAAARFKAALLDYTMRQSRGMAVVVVVVGLAIGATALLPANGVLVRSAAIDGVWRAGAFLAGALLSFGVLFVGSRVAAEGVDRIVAAASKGYAATLTVAFRLALVMGVGIGLPGVLAVIVLMMGAIEQTVHMLVAFALGHAVVALLFRTGGSITSAAFDVSDTLAAPSDEARAVGNYARNGSGMAAEILASMGVLFAAMLLLGVIIADAEGTPDLFDVFGGSGRLWVLFDGYYNMRYVLFPIVLHGIGVVAVLLGGMVVQTSDDVRNARGAFSRGFTFMIASYVILAGAFGVGVLKDVFGSAQTLMLVAAVGVVLLLMFERVISTEAPRLFAPHRKGTRTSLVARLVTGQSASVWGMLAVVVAFRLTYWFYVGGEPIDMMQVFYSMSLIGFSLLVLGGFPVAIHGFGVLSRVALRSGVQAGIDKNARGVLEDFEETGRMLQGLARGVAASGVLLSSLAMAGALAVLVMLDGAQLVPQSDGELILGPVVHFSPGVLVGAAVGVGLGTLFLFLWRRGVVRGAAFLVRQRLATPPDDAAPDTDNLVGRTAAVVQTEVLLMGGAALLVVVLVGFALGAEALVGLAFTLVLWQMAAVVPFSRARLEQAVRARLGASAPAQSSSDGAAATSASDGLNAWPAVPILAGFSLLVVVLIVPFVMAL